MFQIVTCKANIFQVSETVSNIRIIYGCFVQMHSVVDDLSWSFAA